VDRGSIEISGAGDRVAISQRVQADSGNRTLELRSEGGAARIERLEIYELKSAWREALIPAKKME
jgi:sucrose-6-phosphate hydrolase SacC (GH32 family)